MGIWESSPGVWKVDYTDWEYCHFLEGRCILTPERGKPIELKAGDVFVIEPGFKATWEVVEPASREVPSSRASSDRHPAPHPPTVLRARVASSFSHRATSSQVLW
jgi:EutQ-like cupin domain